MAFLETAFQVLILLAAPVGTLIGIRRSRSIWTLAYLSLLGTTITVINFRIAAQLAELAQADSSSKSLFTGSFFQTLSLLGLVLLFVGLSKIQKLRKEQALKDLLEEEN